MKPKNMIGFAAPEATSHAFGRAVLTNIKPSTIPITGLPPNTRKADQEIKAGKKAKAVSVNTTV